MGGGIFSVQKPPPDNGRLQVLNLGGGLVGDQFLLPDESDEFERFCKIDNCPVLSLSLSDFVVFFIASFSF